MQLKQLTILYVINRSIINIIATYTNTSIDNNDWSALEWFFSPPVDVM